MRGRTVRRGSAQVSRWQLPEVQRAAPAPAESSANMSACQTEKKSVFPESTANQQPQSARGNITEQILIPSSCERSRVCQEVGRASGGRASGGRAPAS